MLTDAEKRKQYDIRGEEPIPSQHTHHQYYARGFESDLTAEELFNMFFGASGTGIIYSFFLWYERAGIECKRANWSEFLLTRCLSVIKSCELNLELSLPGQTERHFFFIRAPKTGNSLRVV